MRVGVRWDVGKDRGWFCWPNPRLERTAPSALPLKRKPLGHRSCRLLPYSQDREASEAGFTREVS